MGNIASWVVTSSKHDKFYFDFSVAIISPNAFYECFIARNNFAFNLLLLGHKRRYTW